MARFWVGASGRHYNHWKGRFYPQELSTREWLSFYAARFPTVELNASFYRQPRAKTGETSLPSASLDGPGYDMVVVEDVNLWRRSARKKFRKRGLSCVYYLLIRLYDYQKKIWANAYAP